MRNNLLFVIAMMVSLFVMVSCDGEKDPYITIEYTASDVSATGGNATFTVKSNVSWTVSNADAWVTINPSTGENEKPVTVTFSANTATQSRSSVFTVKSTDGDVTETVTITQAAAGETLSITYTPADVPASGGTATFSVTSNLSAWTVSYSSSDTWVTNVSPTSGSGNADVTVTFAENNTASARSTVFTVAGGALSEAVTVTQSAADLPASAGAITETGRTLSSVVLNIAEIGNATTYKWYKDGSVVQNTAARTYTATAAGTYKVAGVNDAGEGTASANHVVELGAMSMLVGSWDCSNSYYQNSTWNNRGNYVCVFSKVDNQTIAISNFDNLGTAVITATVSVDASDNIIINIPFQAFNPSYFINYANSGLSGFSSTNFKDSFDARTGFSPMTVTKNASDRLTFTLASAYAGANPAYFLWAADESMTYGGQFWYGSNMTWVKQNAASGVPPVNKAPGSDQQRNANIFDLRYAVSY